MQCILFNVYLALDLLTHSLRDSECAAKYVQAQFVWAIVIMKLWFSNLMAEK